MVYCLEYELGQKEVHAILIQVLLVAENSTACQKIQRKKLPKRASNQGRDCYSKAHTQDWQIIIEPSQDVRLRERTTASYVKKACKTSMTEGKPDAMLKIIEPYELAEKC